MNDSAKFARNVLIRKVVFISIAAGAIVLTSEMLSGKDVTTLTNTL